MQPLRSRPIPAIRAISRSSYLQKRHSSWGGFVAQVSASSSELGKRQSVEQVKDNGKERYKHHPEETVSWRTHSSASHSDVGSKESVEQVKVNSKDVEEHHDGDTITWTSHPGNIVEEDGPREVVTLKSYPTERDWLEESPGPVSQVAEGVDIETAKENVEASLQTFDNNSIEETLKSTELIGGKYEPYTPPRTYFPSLFELNATGRMTGPTFGTPLADPNTAITTRVGKKPRAGLLKTESKPSFPRKESAPSIFGGSQVHKVLLRDSCTCTLCVDPSSTQKNFRTTDIPDNIEIRGLETTSNGDVRIQWNNDIAGFSLDHISVYPKSVLDHDSENYLAQNHTDSLSPRLWNQKEIKKELEFFMYQEYMSSNEVLHRVLWLLNTHGLVLIRGVPRGAKGQHYVQKLANRIGNIRDTLYGKTWDVKSVPDAKNVAYTSQYLGLHMDLLYMANPPGLQFLHCLKNTAEGGASLFADSFAMVDRLDSRARNQLAHLPLSYQYRNAGEWYYYMHPVLEYAAVPQTALGPVGIMKRPLRFVNYSPPFQANYPIADTYLEKHLTGYMQGLREFAALTEDPEYLLEYKLQEGECVIFNNRRMLHGRKQFDVAGGERWLKGTYVDTDVFLSKLRHLHQRYGNTTPKPKFVFKNEERGPFNITRSANTTYQNPLGPRARSVPLEKSIPLVEKPSLEEEIE